MAAKKPKRVVSKATRAKLSAASKGRKVSKATRAKLSKANTGKKRTKEQKAAQSLRQTGKTRKISATERAKLVARLKAANHKGHKLTAVQKAALAKGRAAAKVKPHKISAEQRAKMSAARKAELQQRKKARPAPGLSMHAKPARPVKHTAPVNKIPRGLHRMVAAKSERIRPGAFKHGRKVLPARFARGVKHRHHQFRSGRRRARAWK